MTDDGVLTVITPSGVARTTRPPGLRAPGELLVTARAVAIGRPVPPDDDPPPF